MGSLILNEIFVSGQNSVRGLQTCERNPTSLKGLSFMFCRL